MYVKNLMNIKFFPTFGYSEVINGFLLKLWPINMCSLYGLSYFFNKFAMLNWKVHKTANLTHFIGDIFIGQVELFKIMIKIIFLQGDTLTLYLFIISLDYVSW